MKDMFLRLTIYSALIGTGAGILAVVLGVLLTGADSQAIRPSEEDNMLIQPASGEGQEDPNPVEYYVFPPMEFNVDDPLGS